MLVLAADLNELVAFFGMGVQNLFRFGQSAYQHLFFVRFYQLHGVAGFGMFVRIGR